jgi:uncharacterized membrane protein
VTTGGGALRRLLWLRIAPALPFAGGALACRAAGRPGLAALLGLVALAFALGQRLDIRARCGVALALALVAAACWHWPGAASRIGLLLPVLADLAMAMHFGTTLRPGREPLIARYDRFDPASSPAESAGYTRALTRLWALLFLALAPLHAVLLLQLGLSPLPVMTVTFALMLSLFLGEHLVRSRRFPRLGRATPARTLRAVVAAHTAHHHA